MARPRGSQKTPTRRFHKSTGQSIVTIDGKDYYLGAHDSPEAIQKYDRLIAEWLLRGRQGPAASDQNVVIIDQLIAGWLEHLKMETGLGLQPYGVEAMKWLHRCYGDTLAKEFGAVPLMALRMKMAEAKCRGFGKEIERTLSRVYINHMVFEMKRLFKWAARMKMVPSNVWVELQTVEPLKKNKSVAREGKKVTTIESSHVEATIECLTPILAAMVRLQLLTGARAGEIFQMRTCDIDMNGSVKLPDGRTANVWRYRPHKHKTEHHGKERMIVLGPKAQEILRPHLRKNLQDYIFNPAESYTQRRGVRRGSDGQVRVYNQHVPLRDKTPINRTFGKKFNIWTYANAIKRANLRADLLAHQRNPNVPANVPIVKRWHSHQLRHNAATYIRAAFGLDAARACLGHSSTAMTEIYAEIDQTSVERTMAQVG